MKRAKIENSAAVNNNSKTVSKKEKNMKRAKAVETPVVAPKAKAAKKEAKAKTVSRLAEELIEKTTKTRKPRKVKAVETPVVAEPKKRERKVKAVETPVVAEPKVKAKVIDMKDRRERRSMKALESVIEGMKKVNDPKQAKKFMKKYSAAVGVETAERNVRFILHRLNDVSLNSIFLALAVPAKKAA